MFQVLSLCLSYCSFYSLHSLKRKWQLHCPSISRALSGLFLATPSTVEAGSTSHKEGFHCTQDLVWKGKPELSCSLLLYLASNYHIKKGSNNCRLLYQGLGLLYHPAKATMEKLHVMGLLSLKHSIIQHLINESWKDVVSQRELFH